jgi:hypothetical protein
MSWKRTKAKEPLIKLMPILNEATVFVYKEVGDKIQIRHTYYQTTINKSDFKTHLEPVVTNGQIEEVTPELSTYLDDAFKKAQKKG